MTTITRPIKKKAHHIPALKMVSTAPQLLSTTILKRRRNNAVYIFIAEIFLAMKIQVLYQF
jgi:hypothetical protein